MTVHLGETIWLHEEIFDKDGETPIDPDPDGNTIEVYDPEGNELAFTPTYTRLGVGVYEVKTQIPADAVAGTWRWKWTATIGGEPSVEWHHFEVEE